MFGTLRRTLDMILFWVSLFWVLGMLVISVKSQRRNSWEIFWLHLRNAPSRPRPNTASDDTPGGQGSTTINNGRLLSQSCKWWLNFRLYIFSSIEMQSASQARQSDKTKTPVTRLSENFRNFIISHDSPIGTRLRRGRIAWLYLSFWSGQLKQSDA